MPLALFDLDHTLLDGDTNSLWLDYLHQRELVPADSLTRQQTYIEEYLQGRMDISDFLHFQLGLLQGRPVRDWEPLREAFVEEVVRPRILPQGLDLQQEHLAQGRLVAIITATHSFLAERVGVLFGVPVVSSRAEVLGGYLTGRIIGKPCFGAGKLACLHEWLTLRNVPFDDLERGWFYSDSANDLPMLQMAGHPVAVNPDARLLHEAQQRGWPVYQWSEPQSS